MEEMGGGVEVCEIKCIPIKIIQIHRQTSQIRIKI